MTIPDQPHQPPQHSVGREERTAEQGRIGRAAKPLTWGLTLLVVGTGLFAIGAVQALQSTIANLASDGLYAYPAGDPLIITGSLLLVAGLAGTITGVHRVVKRFDALSDAKLYDV